MSPTGSEAEIYVLDKAAVDLVCLLHSLDPQPDRYYVFAEEARERGIQGKTVGYSGENNIITISKQQKRQYMEEDEKIAGRKRLVTSALLRVTVMSLFIVNENIPRLCHALPWHAI